MNILRRHIPTTDLYFLNSCADFVSKGLRSAPVKRVGANTFRCENRYLVIRKDSNRILKSLLKKNGAEITYLVDDDLWGGISDESLPVEYRTRLQKTLNGPVGDVIDKAETLVLSSPKIGHQFAGKKNIHYMTPYWDQVPPNDSHYNNLDQELRIVHLGTNSHTAGQQFLVEVIDVILKKFPRATYTYFSTDAVMGRLDHHPRVIRRRTLGWQGYQRSLRKHRFHLGLYPVMDTPFNQARSVNKILEYPLSGCSAIYSADWAHASEHDLAMSGNSKIAWIDAITEKLSDPDGLRGHYASAIKTYNALNDSAAQRDFWQRLFIKGDA